MQQHDASTRACRYCGGRLETRAGIEPLIVSEREAARLLGLDKSTLRRRRKSGDGPPAIWVTDRRLGYRLADLRAWLAARPEA